VAAAGDDTIVLLAGYTGGTDVAAHLDVTRIAPSGHPASAYSQYVVATGGTQEHLVQYRLATLGSSVVAAWLGPGPLGIARMSP
jgi:hypothetical protein